MKDIDRNEEVFCISQMWIQAWFIPVQWLSLEITWKIGKIFNYCHNVAIQESGSKEERYVKLLVDVDLTKALIRRTKVCFEEEKRWVSFKYESLSLYCFYCSMIRHGERVWEENG